MLGVWICGVRGVDMWSVELGVWICGVWNYVGVWICGVSKYDISIIITDIDIL